MHYFLIKILIIITRFFKFKLWIIMQMTSDQSLIFLLKTSPINLTTWDAWLRLSVSVAILPGNNQLCVHLTVMVQQFFQIHIFLQGLCLWQAVCISVFLLMKFTKILMLWLKKIISNTGRNIIIKSTYYT